MLIAAHRDAVAEAQLQTLAIEKEAHLRMLRAFVALNIRGDVTALALRALDVPNPHALERHHRESFPRARRRTADAAGGSRIRADACAA